MKKKTLSVAVLGAMLAFGFASQAQAASTIMFDPDGAGGAFSSIAVDVFDWLPSSALAVGSNPASLGTKFTLYTHGLLGAMTKGGVAIDQSLTGIGAPLTAAHEFTFVAGFGEVVTSGTGTVPGASTFALDGSNPTNFFEIYYDAGKDSDNDLDVTGAPAGTGFNNGTLIMSGKIGYADGSFGVGSVPAIPPDLDGFNTNSLPGVRSLRGAGGTNLDVGVSLISYYDPNFFTDGVPGFLLSFNTSNVMPFNQVDPATVFTGGSGGVVPAIFPSIGVLNGAPILLGGGPDIMFQVDANNSFTPVPEPATMMLLGTGLVGLAGIGRKRSRK